MQIQEINPIEYGIQEPQAEELMGNLPQIRLEREHLIKSYNEIIVADIEDEATSQLARLLRLKIKDNRTKGIETWHKNTKEFFLKGGQFVDAIKRKEVEVNKRMEDNLEQIENYQAIKLQKQIEELQKARLEELSPYLQFIPQQIYLGEMSDDDFLKLKNGAILLMNQKIEEEKKAEELRIAKQKQDEEEKERARIENEKLLAEVQKRNKELEIERAKLLEEQKAKAELQRQMDLQKADELKKQKEAIKLAKKPLKIQIVTWIDEFELPTPPKSDEAIISDIISKFEAFKKWAKTEVDKAL